MYGIKEEYKDKGNNFYNCSSGCGTIESQFHKDIEAAKTKWIILN